MDSEKGIKRTHVILWCKATLLPLLEVTVLCNWNCLIFTQWVKKRFAGLLFFFCKESINLATCFFLTPRNYFLFISNCFIILFLIKGLHFFQIEVTFFGKNYKLRDNHYNAFSLCFNLFCKQCKFTESLSLF